MPGSRADRFTVRHVTHMPATLEPGILYVTKAYKTAAHLCACGCASKVRTPLGPAEWVLQENRHGATMEPSIGNWQRRCRSHYWIVDGQVRWDEPWTEAEVAVGRGREVARRNTHYGQLREARGMRTLWRRLVQWFGRDR